MSDEDIRRDDAAHDAVNGEAPDEPRKPDAVISALRDIPRLRSIEEEAPGKFRSHRPPPPMVSRISGLSQGCSGVLMLLLSVVMIMAAISYGFYLWGPGILMVSAMVVIAATIGVWRGQRVPVAVSIVALFAAMIIGYQWEAFITIAGRLVPLGGVGMLIGPAAGLIAMVLLVALVSNLLSLIYWRRLFPSTTRGIAIWVGSALALVVIAVVFHFTQQQQREAWLTDHYDEWTAEAETDSLQLGSSLSVTLGYSFTTAEEDDTNFFDVHSAELKAAKEAGTQVIRLTASGDMLLEAETPTMFDIDEEDPESVQEAQDRIDRQLQLETDYMALVQESGADLVLVDYQYSPYLLMLSYDTEESMPWADFIELQENRIRHYAALYQPAFYEIVNEPSQYEEYSAISGPEDEDEVDAWVEQTTRLITAVQEESPDTQIGVSLALQRDLDEAFYLKLLDMDGIDYIGFRIYQPAAFQVLEDFLLDNGHPAEYGKQLWINETWYGACLAPQRSQKLDGLWLETVAAFAATEDIATVLASDFGCFVNEGGTRTTSDPDLEGRTDVWETWRDLIAKWQGS